VSRDIHHNTGHQLPASYSARAQTYVPPHAHLLEDAPLREAEATKSPDVASQDIDPVAANRQAALRAPSTPQNSWAGEGSSLGDEKLGVVEDVFVTARTTRVCEDEDTASHEELSPRAPQYLVLSDESVDSNNMSYRSPRVFEMPVSLESEQEQILRDRSSALLSEMAA
jgi:hypothetical protein